MYIIGRLTRDVVVKELPSGKQVVNFSVAQNKSYKNKQGERVNETTYFDCSYWITPKVAEFLKQGTLVELHGSVTARPYFSKNGEPKASLKFRTSAINFLAMSKKENVKPNEKKWLNSNKQRTIYHFKVLEVYKIEERE